MMALKAPPLSREKEALILDAAQRRFAAFGPAKVTMDEIAADVGMGKASLYYYFPTKDDLFRHVIAREQVEFMGRLHDILMLDVSAAEKLRRYADKRLDYFKTLLNLQFLNLNTFINPKPVFRDLFEAFAVEELKALTEIVRDGERRGEFEIKSAEAIARLLLHLMQGLRLRMIRAAQFSVEPAAEPMELAREIRLMIDIFLGGIQRNKIPSKSERA